MRVSILISLCLTSLCGLLAGGYAAEGAEPPRLELRITMDLGGMDLASAVALLSSQSGQSFEVAAGTDAKRHSKKISFSELPLQQAISTIATSYGVCVAPGTTVTSFRSCKGTDSTGKTRLGVTLRPQPAQTPYGAGISIAGVTDGGVAASAGIQEDDIVLSLDGRPTGTVSQLREPISEITPGTAVTFEILRGEQRHSLTVQF